MTLRRFSHLRWIKFGLGAAATLLVTPHGAAWLGPPPSAFQGAGVGLPVPFETIALPAVSQTIGQDDPVPAFCPWAPTFEQLVTTDTVITTEAQLRYAWRRLFTEPFDASLVDFSESFVVLMGGGLQTVAQFEISFVEQFQASYECPFRPCLGSDEPALAVTATLLFPGIPPKRRPPLTYRLAAVKVPQQYLDDVIFHRVTLFAP